MAKRYTRATEEDNEDLSFGGWRDWLLVVVGGAMFLATLWAVVQFALANRGRGPVQVDSIDAAMIVGAALGLAGAIGALKRWWS